MLRKIIKDLGFSYEKFPACLNDCMLFKNENVNDEMCLICGASRWISNTSDLERQTSASYKKDKEKKLQRLCSGFFEGKSAKTVCLKNNFYKMTC